MIKTTTGSLTSAPANFSDPGSITPACAVSPYVTSNLFVTFAWYGDLRFKEVSTAGVIVASSLIGLRRILSGRARQSQGQRRLHHGSRRSRK
jgi:hypothetical protein